ncbi:MAG: leucine-rich repeat domain-containing protein [Bacteroidetes bacterium]|jgi:Leucine-rich repeat (LRR) protein|nr:leucine-rich repeat domain-containing protein [Bacteroidota bacterium]MBK9318660.1 leucine-rich repeat domain-containing protein [Bacteroidota bacterium]
MNKYILLFLFFIAPNFVADSYGQEVLDSASLSLQRSFRNLGDALLQPDSVFKMDLSRQKRKVVPEEVRKFRNLQVLKLSRNNLREIPEWIGELKNLQVLDLGYNKLKALPPGIGNCKQLVFLGLNRNLIETLPKEIGQLELLEVLEMWDNEVQYLPEEIKMLHNLKVFELRGILFSQQEQDQIRQLLPDTDVLFSPSCNCK